MSDDLRSRTEVMVYAKVFNETQVVGNTRINIIYKVTTVNKLQNYKDLSLLS